ncbi:AAA family ATPase [Pseudomonas sp.]|uniref:AAA family ATPase n=1 Tax=Pseudomonas sp. TaxID=306 RepID=UPI002BF3AF22|nr:AAA family ATPase [Pseudomonas sp.]HUE91486.1 AAA family ATPase [Pseudomonas sp.]
MKAPSDRFSKEWEGVSVLPTAATPLWRAELTQASSIVPVPIRWLWPGWIARGKLIVLAGAGGSGKTTLAIGLIATLTSGGRWPDGEICTEPGNALIWSSEDDPADTLVPRLMAAGADLSRVHIVQGRINSLGEREPFDPGTDFDLLRAAVDSIGGASLLLLDPVVNVVKGDMHRANDTRRSLQVVVDFAAEHWCAVLGISHFSKGSGASSPADRVIGSQAFGALARAVLVAAKQEDSDVRVLARAKSNISDDQGGVGYLVEPCTVGEGIETTRVLWGDRIEGSARDILADVESTGDDDQRTEFEEACDFLRDTLKHGSVPTKQVKAEASDAGLSWATVRRAQKAIGAIAIKEGGRLGNEKQQWVWSLPAEGAHKTQKALTKNSEHLLENVSTFCGAQPPSFDESDAEEL